MVQQLLGHASVTTTIDTFAHLTVEDLRRELRRAGRLSRSLEPPDNPRSRSSTATAISAMTAVARRGIG